MEDKKVENKFSKKLVSDKPLPGETTVHIKSKNMLSERINQEILKACEGILDFAQVAVPSKDVFMSYRARVLRICNNCIRQLQRELGRHYKVEFVPDTEDVIIVEKRPLSKKDI